MDLRSTLRSLVIIPKVLNPINAGEYNYPEKIINFLYLVRDHYTKYHTTSALFHEDPKASFKLKDGGSIDSLNYAVELYLKSSGEYFNQDNYLTARPMVNNKTPFLNNSIAVQSGIPYNVAFFIFLSTLGFATTEQLPFLTLQSRRYIGENSNDKQAVINCVYDKGVDGTYIEAGITKTRRNPPYEWTELNGTIILSLDTVPSGQVIVDMISDILAEAYSYYYIKDDTRVKNTWVSAAIAISPYVKVFTSGKVSLQYLKAIQVRDKILKTDKGLDLYLFPAFLIYNDSLLSVDPYDDLSLRVDSTTIKKSLEQAIAYIEGQIFAQDINTLNKIDSRLVQALDVNNQAKAKLDSEVAKLNRIQTDLEATLLEAKKIYTTYDYLKNTQGGKTDTVANYIQELNTKMETELADFLAQEKARLEKIAIDQKAADLKVQLDAEVKAQQEQLAVQTAQAETQRLEAEATYQAQLKASQSLQSTNNVLSIDSTSSVEDKAVEKKSKVLPIVAGLGVLAYLTMGGEE